MPHADLPALLQEQGGAWYGEGALWTQLPAEGPAARQPDGSLTVKHAWVTLDGRGRSTSRMGPPTFEVERVGAPGRATASSGGFATTADFSWWPTVFNYPQQGCWAEIGRLGETRVRLVVHVS